MFAASSGSFKMSADDSHNCRARRAMAESDCHREVALFKSTAMNSSRLTPLIPVVLALGLIAGWAAIARRAGNSLVVYCTHDLVYAEPVLEEFTRRTGIAVTLVGDTEATKSLGLTERLLREGKQTPCDLFWNNEVLGMIRLQRKGLLQTYSGPATQRFPDRFRDPTGQWCGFAGRMRVWIKRGPRAEGPGPRASKDFPETEGTLTPSPSPEGRGEPEVVSNNPPSAIAHPPFANDEGPMTKDFFSLDAQPSTLNFQRLAIAKPLYGTTFTQFALLWKLHGAERTKAFHQSLVDRGTRFVAGNAMVRDVVAGGSCDSGMTDTDDVFAALDAGHEVVMEPIRIDGKTICIPNTVALIQGSDRPDEARQLLEYLLSEEVELQLAKTARQIPLGKVAPEKIPAEVQPLANWASESWNVADAADVADECLHWLKSEYAR
jgi:iron(III) transport system substrate-binding protein